MWSMFQLISFQIPRSPQNNLLLLIPRNAVLIVPLHLFKVFTLQEHRFGIIRYFNYLNIKLSILASFLNSVYLSGIEQRGKKKKKKLHQKSQR
jgi:hypothetical protein